MLQAIRSKAATWVIRVLLGVLVVSFGLWGVPEAFQGAKDPWVAKVGKTEIPLSRLQDEVKQTMSSAQRRLGRQFSNEEAKALGLIDQTVQQLISWNLLDNGVAALQLAASDDAVREVVHSMAQFKDETGSFSRLRFDEILRANGYTEQKYLAAIRREITRRQMLETVISAAALPQVSRDLIYANRYESRIVEIATLPYDQVTVAKPSDDELAAYLKEHVNAFTAPEYRSFSLVTLSPEMMAAGMTVSEDEIKNEYEVTKDSLGSPEKRTIEQIVFADEAKAKDAQDKIVKGADFAAVAKATSGIEAADLVLGTMAKTELPGEFAEPVFALAKGKVSAPVKSAFGWHLFRVTAIEAAALTTFEQARDQLRNQIALQKAVDALNDKTKEIEDALAGGASLEEIAEKQGLPLDKVAGTDAAGKNDLGEAVANMPSDQADLLTSVFDASQGEISDLVAGTGDTSYIFRVDDITASRPYTVDEKRLALHSAWTEAKQKAAATEQAGALVKLAQSGGTFADLAKKAGWSYRLSNPLSRIDRGDNPELGRDAMNALFDLKVNELVATADADGKAKLVIRIKEITPAPAASAEQSKEIQEQVDRMTAADLPTSFESALKAAYPVEIRQDVINAQF